MNDDVSKAIETLREAFGFSLISVWPADDENADVQAFFMAKDEAALLAAALDYVTANKPHS